MLPSYATDAAMIAAALNVAVAVAPFRDPAATVAARATGGEEASAGRVPSLRS